MKCFVCRISLVSMLLYIHSLSVYINDGYATENVSNERIVKQQQNTDSNTNQHEEKNVEYSVEEIEKLFLVFNQDDKIASISDIKDKDYPWLIENVAKLNILKKHYIIQNDDELRKKYEMEILSKEEELARANRVENSMLLMSLVYFNEKYWKCSIDGKKIDNLTQNDAHKKASIVKVNKRSILFVLNITDKDNVALVSKIIANKKPNHNQYQIIKSGTKKIVMFRLFVGQKIDFDTMEISSISGIA